MEEAILHSDMNTIKLLINRDNAKSAFLYACEKGKLNVVDYLYSKSKLYGLSPSLLYKAVLLVNHLSYDLNEEKQTQDNGELHEQFYKILHHILLKNIDVVNLIKSKIDSHPTFKKLIDLKDINNNEVILGDLYHNRIYIYLNLQIYQRIKDGLSKPNHDTLMSAFMENDIEMIKLLKKNNEIFILACIMGNIEVVKVFLNDPKLKLKQSQRPIVKASQNGQLDIVQLLLTDLRFDPSVNHNEALKLATQYEHYDVVQLLLTDERVVNNEDYLLLLINQGSLNEVRSLLNRNYFSIDLLQNFIRIHNIDIHILEFIKEYISLRKSIKDSQESNVFLVSTKKQNCPIQFFPVEITDNIMSFLTGNLFMRPSLFPSISYILNPLQTRMLYQTILDRLKKSVCPSIPALSHAIALDVNSISSKPVPVQKLANVLHDIIQHSSDQLQHSSSSVQPFSKNEIPLNPNWKCKLCDQSDPDSKEEETNNPASFYVRNHHDSKSLVWLKPCGHVFHYGCIEKEKSSLYKNRLRYICPVCRFITYRDLDYWYIRPTEEEF